MSKDDLKYLRYPFYKSRKDVKREKKFKKTLDKKLKTHKKGFYGTINIGNNPARADFCYSFTFSNKKEFFEEIKKIYKRLEKKC